MTTPGAGFERGANSVSPTSQLWSFFVGLTLFFVIGVALHVTGYIYVHTRSDLFGAQRRVAEAVGTAEPYVEPAIAALSEADVALQDAIQNGSIAKYDTGGKFVTAGRILPEMFSKSGSVARAGNAQISVDGSAYKVLISSDACPAVALTMPWMVDPRRTRFDIFCQYFGVWNVAGKGL